VPGKGAAWRFLGHALFGSGFVFAALALAVVIWLVTGQGDPLAGWWPALAVGLTAVSLTIAALNRWDKLIIDLALVGLGGASVLTASIWLGVLRFGAVPGSLTGIAVAVTIIGTVLGGNLLRNRFAKPSANTPQRAFDRWLESLYSNGLLPLAIASSASARRFYHTKLSILNAAFSDASAEIDTPASGELRRLLRQRSKGSFALAGPRGSGKSTLLDRWCAGQLLRDVERVPRARHDLTIKVDAPAGHQSTEFLIHLFGKLCDAVEDYATTLAVLDYGPRESALRRMLRMMGSAALDRAARPYGIVRPSDLAARAREERDRIRALQSHTKEREFSLGFTPMMGTSIGYRSKGTLRRDEVPLSHPELVDRFRDFLGQTAQLVAELDCKVLIGIDEVDRISDVEGMQRFLDELNAVFNVPNCYFLVSVSEEALAEFELAATGMRSVFEDLRHNRTGRLLLLRAGQGAAQPACSQPARTVRCAGVRLLRRARPGSRPDGGGDRERSLGRGAAPGHRHRTPGAAPAPSHDPRRDRPGQPVTRSARGDEPHAGARQSPGRRADQRGAAGIRRDDGSP
jgi:hypothetical protein